MKILKSTQGLALFMVIFVMAFFLLFITGGVIFSQIELKKTTNLKLANQAFETADSGLQHALTLIGSGYDFNAQLNGGDPPGTVVLQTYFPSGSGFSYTVTARNDETDLNNGGSATHDKNNTVILNSTATGPGGTKRAVEAYVKRSIVSFAPPGALYLPANSATIRFDGSNTFFITGNDTDYNGSSAPSPKPSTAGVAVIYDAVRGAVRSALGSNHYSQVQGSGYVAGPTVTPSVIVTGNIFSVNQTALNFYNHPNAVKFLDGFRPVCPLNLSLPRPIPDPCILGTDSSPQFTYVRESTTEHIHLEGYVKGSGVLVIEGKAHIYGDFEFHGLVIHVSLGLTGGSASALLDLDELVDGVSPFSMRNNAKIFGAILKGPTDQPQHFEMRNSSKIYYSSRGLSLVNTENWGSLVPQPPRVFAWLDK